MIDYPQLTEQERAAFREMLNAYDDDLGSMDGWGVFEPMDYETWKRIMKPPPMRVDELQEWIGDISHSEFVKLHQQVRPNRILDENPEQSILPDNNRRWRPNTEHEEW